MRMRGLRPKKFQMGGGAGGTAFTPQNTWTPSQMQPVGNPNSPWAAANFPGNPNNPSWATPQAQQAAAALFAQQAAQGAGAGAANPLAARLAQAQAQGGANPLAQQLAARGAMPTPAAGAGPASTLGAAAPGGMMPPGAGGVPGAAGPAGMGNFQPRPGMGWGAAPGAGAMGVPAGGATGMAGAGIAPGVGAGMPAGGAAGMGPQQQALLGALAGRGTGAPGAGVPGAAPNVMGAGVNPAVANQMGALAGAGLGFAEGGEVKTVKGGRVSKFDSTKPAPGNLATHAAGKKLAKGGVVRRKPPAAKAAKAKEDRRSPSPVPAYDTPPAGDDGWPPTPSFTAAAGPNVPPPGMPPGMAKGGKWIAGAIKHPGALHKQLGVPQGEKIPEKKLSKAAQAGGKLGQRARLAETLKGMKKARGGKCVEDTDKDGMRKGGECDKMAAGGAAKQRKGFPNTLPPPKRMASGGTVRGSGIAQRGTRFSGIY